MSSHNSPRQLAPASANTSLQASGASSANNGAAVFVQSSGASGASSANNAWGGAGPGSALKANPWKKAVVQESGLREDSWGGEDSFDGSSDPSSVWKGKEAPIAATINRWSVLDSETGVSSSSGTVRTEDLPKPTGVISNSGMDSNAANSNSSGLPGVGFNVTEPLEVIDDWEKAYE